MIHSQIQTMNLTKYLNIRKLYKNFGAYKFFFSYKSVK